MNVKFILQSPPFSINKYYYYGKPKVVRTQAARKWGENIHKQLLDLGLNDQFEKARKLYNPKTMGIAVKLVFGIKRERFFTKRGTINRRAMDLSNIEKPLIDLIFAEKYLKRDGICNLGIDDQYICKLESEKAPADIDTIAVEITIYPLKSLLTK